MFNKMSVKLSPLNRMLEIKTRKVSLYLQYSNPN